MMRRIYPVNKGSTTGSRISGFERPLKRISRFLFSPVLCILIVLSLFLVFPAGALTDSWTQVNEGGFGADENWLALSMCEFDSNLYVGTGRFAKGCQIWRASNGKDWAQVNVDGFGDDKNDYAYSMCVFGSNLYVGTHNENGCEIWRTRNGEDWTQVNTNGFGDSGNGTVGSMSVFGSRLYVFTNKCRVFRTSNGTDWTQVNTDGFGDENNVFGSSMCVFGSNLYVGTMKRSESKSGCEIWRSSNGSDWRQVNTDGFGDANNGAADTMRSFGSDLYVGTYNVDDGCEVWKSSNGTNWTQANTNGFGDVDNGVADSMCVFTGNIYVGTANADDEAGCEVWKSSDGLNWTCVGSNGFGNKGNIGVYSMSAFESYLYAGTWEESGCEIWRTAGPTEPTCYLAEGSNAWGFNTYISIENPSNETLHAKVTYMNLGDPNSGKGIPATRTVELPPLSQTTVSSMPDIGEVDFSTKVECLEGQTISVDRTMFWTGEGAPSPEGHSSAGVNSPERTWYLPEGSCAWGFETWTLVQNPNPEEARVTLTYMIEGEGSKSVEKSLHANSRATWDMAEELGFKADASVKVTSDQPVIAEQSMYRNNRREGSCSMGTAEPAADYYLAEGTTSHGFTTYVLVQNPNDSEVEVTLTYNTPDGPAEQPEFTMPANSRRTIKVNDVLADTDFSTKVHGSKPVIAARSMYWGAGGPLGEATHSSIGIASPHMVFYLPDGQTGDGYETYTLVQNPENDPVPVEITYLPQGGGKAVTFTDEIPAGSRKTYNMADKLPSGRASIMVRSVADNAGIICERSMYWNNRGAGTDTIGGYRD